MTLSKVLETFAVTGKSTVVVECLADGKSRATSLPWNEAKAVLRDQVIEIRAKDGKIRVALKERAHDEDDPPVEPYDPYGPGANADDLGAAVEPGPSAL